MSFLSSAFLFALPLAAVPVIIHLFHRRRKDVVHWGAMQFLIANATKRRRIMRIDDLILMLIRALALILIVLAMARPLVSSRWWGSAGNREVIFVIDTSLSTGYTVDGRTAFDGIKQRALDLIDQLDAGDTLRVLTATNSPRWLLPVEVRAGTSESKLRLRQVIEELRPTLAAADLLASVRTAIAAAPSGSPNSRTVIVLTDGIAHGWNAEASNDWNAVKREIERAAVPTRVHVALAGDEPLANDESGETTNRSIENVESLRRLVGVGDPITVTARLKNTGTTEMPPTTVAWSTDGESRGLSSVPSLEAGAVAEVSFEETLDSVGVFAISCRLESRDPLVLDDAGTLIVESAQGIPVLIVADIRDQDDPGRGLSYLRASLGGGDDVEEAVPWTSAFEPTVITYDELSGHELSEFSCVLLLNADSLTRGSLENLTDFARQGGGIWVTLGDRTDPATFNRQWCSAETALCPLEVDQPVGDADDEETFVSIHPPDEPHPATALLGDTERLDVNDVRIHRRFRFAQPTTDSTISTLLETGEGNPLVVENTLGRGRIIVQAFPLGPEWSNLPLCNVFVAMVHEWLWYLAEPSGTRWNLTPHSPLEWRRDLPPPATELTVTTPAGEVRNWERSAQGERAVLRYDETDDPGDYVLTVGGDESGGSDESAESFPFHVQRDSAESELTPLSDEQRELLRTAGSVEFRTDPLAIVVEGDGQAARSPFWNVLLVGLLLLIVAEMLLAGKLAARRYGTSAQATLVR